MICPACKSLMIVVEHKKIELDYCPECQGVWFDTGELDLLLEYLDIENRDQFVSSILSSPEAKTPEKKRRCPICTRRMKKVIAGEEPSILIDACRRADGLWFDGGKVGKMIERLPVEPLEKSRSQNRINTFLKEVFQEREQTTPDKK